MELAPVSSRGHFPGHEYKVPLAFQVKERLCIVYHKIQAIVQLTCQKETDV